MPDYIKQLKIGNTDYNIKAEKASNNASSSFVVRDIQYGTTTPSGGESGQVYLQYDASSSTNNYIYAEDTASDQQNVIDNYYSKNEVNVIIESELDALAKGHGEKNLIANQTPTETKSGITYTLQNDGSVKCTGTFTANSWHAIAWVYLDVGEYILTGCPSGGGTEGGYTLRLADSNDSLIARDDGNGIKFTITTADNYVLRIYAYSNNISGKTFYPMIRYAELASDTYVPRIPTIYSADWTASSSSANNTILTQKIYLPEGTYIIYCHRPTCSSTSFSMNMRVNGNDFRNYTVGTQTDNICAIQRFTVPGYIEMVSTQSASVTFSNLERGKLIAVRIGSN